MMYETRLGKLEIQENEVIEFPEGIPGFEELRKFAIISLQETLPFVWLTSLEDKDVALPLIDPWLIKQDYSFVLSEEEQKFLKVNDQSEIFVWTVVTIPVDSPKSATVNLKAPIVVNLKEGIGKQIILEEHDIKYPLRGEKDVDSN